MVEIQSKQVPRWRYIRALALWALAATPVVAAFACTLQADDPYAGLGGQGPANSSTATGPDCIGPNCPSQCEANPHPGCKCDVEGQHLLCGKVDATYPDGTPVCGKGVSVCTNGKWGECTINGAVTLVPDAPPGYWATGLGTGSTCTNNPCDPGCISFDDDGSGLSDDDAGISATDAGVTLVGDGGNLCVPKSCADQGKNCGPVSDTCGGLLNCGTCPAGQTCGGAGTPSVCGAGGNCTNLCLQQVVCPNNGTTSLTGKVYAPNGVDPLPNAVVYVPNAPLDPFPAGVSCDNCLQASGSPLVSTTSGVDGSFTLTNMPVGTNIPLVIQIGRWRRQVTIPQITACANNDLTPSGSCGVVIDQIYAGGGSSGSTWRNDFVVLHNKGLATVSLSNWSLQYAAATGTSWTKLNLTGSIVPGGYRLIRLAGGFFYGSAVSNPDQSSTAITMNPTSGKLALVGNKTTLSGSCPTANIIDFVGYGSANCSEGNSPVPALSLTKSASRKASGCTDTNVNSADFTVSSPAPAPRNSSSPASICSSCDVLTRFPKNKSEGDIPKIAFVTGQVDAMECVFRKIGLEDAEFTNPGGGGRIAFYWGGYSGGTYINASTPGEYDLVSSPSELAKYDMVLFPCQGAQYAWTGGYQATFQNNIADYVDAGGRIFTTHFNYIWLIDDGGTYASPLSPAVNWDINQWNPSSPQTGYIDQSFPKGQTLAQWLQIIGASTTLGQISINTLRHDFDSVVAPSQRWMYLDDGTPMHLTFNTPLGAPATQQCGRVVFSDFHVYDSNDTQYPFPDECSNGAMTPQEKLLEYMLFDLASCVQPDTPPACMPTSCAQQGLNCGMAGDGCGNTIDCGSCAAPMTCGGGGLPGVCGLPITFSDGYFVRDYDATGICPEGTGPVWRLYSWGAVTPGDSRIEFFVQTATNLADLAAAPLDPLVFSNPPGPVALVDQPGVAHAANVPAGTPDTQVGAASPDYTLLTNSRIRGYDFLRVTAHLVPTSNGVDAPTLSSWNMQIDCLPNQ